MKSAHCPPTCIACNKFVARSWCCGCNCWCYYVQTQLSNELMRWIVSQCGVLAASGNFDRVRDDTKSKKKSLHIHTHSERECEKCIISHAIGKFIICTYITRVFYLLQRVCVFFIFLFFSICVFCVGKKWICWLSKRSKTSKLRRKKIV